MTKDRRKMMGDSDRRAKVIEEILDEKSGLNTTEVARRFALREGKITSREEFEDLKYKIRANIVSKVSYTLRKDDRFTFKRGDSRGGENKTKKWRCNS